MSQEFHEELIERFLALLDSHEREALGSRDRIRISFAQGSPESYALAEKTNLLINPTSPVLHVQSESIAHQFALELSIDSYLKAAAAAGFQWLCLNPTPMICYAHFCGENK